MSSASNATPMIAVERRRPVPLRVLKLQALAAMHRAAAAVYAGAAEEEEEAELRQEAAAIPAPLAGPPQDTAPWRGGPGYGVRTEAEAQP